MGEVHIHKNAHSLKLALIVVDELPLSGDEPILGHKHLKLSAKVRSIFDESDIDF